MTPARLTSGSHNGRIALGALLVALLHPVTISLLRGGRAAEALERNRGAAGSDAWTAVVGAVAHAGDAIAVAAYPPLWPLLAVTGEPPLSTFLAVLVLMLATWGVSMPTELRSLRTWWWAGISFSVLAAATIGQGMLYRSMFTAAVVLTVGSLAAAVMTIASRTRAGSSPALVLLVAVVSLASLRLLPAWGTTSALANAAVAAAPNSAQAQVALAASAVARGDSDGELEALRRALTLAPRDVQVRRALGAAYSVRGGWNEAERHLTKVATLRPDDTQIAIDAADAAARAGRWLRARSLVARAAEHFNEDRKLDDVAPAVAIELARRLARHDKLDAAARVYGELAMRNDVPPGIAREHGLVLAAAGRESEAVAAFRSALVEAPSDADSAIELAWLLATSAAIATTPETKAEALRWASRAAEQRPTDPTALDTLAAAQAAGGDYSSATASAMRALELGRPLGDEEWLGAVQRRLEDYRQGRPYRQTSAATSRQNARNPAEEAAVH